MGPHVNISSNFNSISKPSLYFGNLHSVLLKKKKIVIPYFVDVELSIHWRGRHTEKLRKILLTY